MRLALGVALLAAVLWVLLRGPQTLDVQFSPWAWAFGLLGSVAANAVTAWRWRLLSEAMTTTRLPYGVYFHNLATTRVLGQFLPSLVVDLVGRSAGLRAAGSGERMGRLMVPLVIERILDLVLPAVLLGWSLALQRGLVTGAAAWASLALLVLVFATLAAPLLAPMVRAALWLWARLARWRNPEARAPELPIIPAALARIISALSTLRWAAVAMQYWGAAAGLGVALPALVLLAAAPAGQLAGLVGVTPGALGIQEGGWAGALTLLGVGAGDIAVIIVALRAAMIVNFALIAAATWRWRGVPGEPQPSEPRLARRRLSRAGGGAVPSEIAVDDAVPEVDQGQGRDRDQEFVRVVRDR